MVAEARLTEITEVDLKWRRLLLLVVLEMYWRFIFVMLFLFFARWRGRKEGNEVVKKRRSVSPARQDRLTWITEAEIRVGGYCFWCCSICVFFFLSFFFFFFYFCFFLLIIYSSLFFFIPFCVFSSYSSLFSSSHCYFSSVVLFNMYSCSFCSSCSSSSFLLLLLRLLLLLLLLLLRYNFR